MDFSAENSQNSAPGSLQAAKLGGTRKGPDSQSVSKRYVFCSSLAHRRRLCLVKAK